MDLQDLKLDYEAKLSSPELCIMKGDNDRKGDNISNHKEDEMNLLYNIACQHSVAILNWKLNEDILKSYSYFFC